MNSVVTKLLVAQIDLLIDAQIMSSSLPLNGNNEYPEEYKSIKMSVNDVLFFSAASPDLIENEPKRTVIINANSRKFCLNLLNGMED